MKKEKLHVRIYFLLYIPAKKKKKMILFVCYLHFCISLQRIIIRYLRSNRLISHLIINDLYILITFSYNFSRNYYSFH